MTMLLKDQSARSRRRRSPERNLSRRNFLQVGAAAGGGLLLGFALPSLVAQMSASAADGDFAPNGFIRIGQDGRVAVIVPQVEMGQGTFTSFPMLVAEELEVDLAQVEFEQAPPNQALYVNQLVGFQVTGGSTSIRAFYQPLRQAGATARTMLIAAAADTWNVDPRLLPRRERERDPHADGAKARLWRAGRQGRDAAGAGKGRAQGSEGLQAGRNAGQAPRHAGQGQRQGRLRHRCQGAGHEDRRRSRLARCSAASSRA